ncbi:MAG TPA: PIN domain-containing protein [Puia sp.]|nr:PIN domain-containing protein [Puia sp.]
MRVLLDTNIIIHREASKIINKDIGILFNWLDKLHYSKCVHPLTATELNRHADVNTVKTMNIKLTNYQILKTEAPIHTEVSKVSLLIDVTENDKDDTKLLNEVYCDRVDILISEDKKIHSKAAMLGIADKVFRIDTFLEKVTSENPDLINYKVLAVKKEHFGKVNLNDQFFDTFKEDYIGFEKWFNKKSDEIAYVCFDNNILSAFLFVKVESEDENYSDITPIFQKRKRLKIGTFKVTSNGIKLGERFLKIIFDNARQYKVDEIYVTIFDKRPEQLRLISLLEDYGFKNYGIKKSISDEEKVYVRNFNKNANREFPKLTFPYISRESKVFIVPIYPEYHTELFPDSILRTEDKNSYLDSEPHRNSISKSYISHSRERNLSSGDVIIFYRTGGIYQGVATTIGIVENVILNIQNEEELIKLCRKRTVLKEDELKKFWNRYRTNKPFIVNFLYAYSFRKRPNLKQLMQLGVIPDIQDMPRGFREISWEIFTKLVKFSGL